MREIYVTLSSYYLRLKKWENIASERNTYQMKLNINHAMKKAEEIIKTEKY